MLIDEAQDWPCSWFHCARLALKEPDAGDLLIVGDGSQSLYRKRDFTWADAGIQASGRVINKKFDLDRNYRNTAEILRAARAVLGASHGRQQGMPALPIEPDTAIRSGPEPWLIQLDDRGERGALRRGADRDLAARRPGNRRPAPAHQARATSACSIRGDAPMRL